MASLRVGVRVGVFREVLPRKDKLTPQLPPQKLLLRITLLLSWKGALAGPAGQLGLEPIYSILLQGPAPLWQLTVYFFFLPLLSSPCSPSSCLLALGWSLLCFPGLSLPLSLFPISNRGPTFPLWFPDPLVQLHAPFLPLM